MNFDYLRGVVRNQVLATANLRNFLQAMARSFTNISQLQKHSILIYHKYIMKVYIVIMQTYNQPFLNVVNNCNTRRIL